MGDLLEVSICSNILSSGTLRTYLEEFVLLVHTKVTTMPMRSIV
jgi:hypothetical protein